MNAFDRPSAPTAAELRRRLMALDAPLALLRFDDGGFALAEAGAPLPPGTRLAGLVPALQPEDLGSARFRAAHGLRLAYAAGSMAGGIASERLVTALGRAGLLAGFGAAGLSLERIEAAIRQLREALPQGPWAVNLIHTPDRPEDELARVALFRRLGVTTIEASAFMELTPAVVAFRAGGLAAGPGGVPLASTRVVAKLSHPRVAEQFLSPPPAALVEPLVADGTITRAQAELAARLPVAEDVTVEADSGGHTDNRPLVGLLPAMLRLRDRLQARHGYAEAPRIGAAGGLGSPEAVAAAFALGADYVVTGSINQACREAGTSEAVKALLAEAGFDDVAMAPAADMFEQGVQVQVLKRGTLFAMRARRLWELYRSHDSWAAIPEAERARVERELFRAPADAVWAECERYLAAAEPAALAEARASEKRRLGLLFRWYLGLSSKWAGSGDAERRSDYQVWCGPAMAAFNDWTAGSPMAEPAGRGVVEVAEALMRGAAYLARLAHLRAAGLELPAELSVVPPEPPASAAPAGPAIAPAAAAPQSAPQSASQPAPPDADGERPDAEAIQGWLIAEIAVQLGVPEEEIDPRRSFESYDLDSAQALAVMSRLEGWLQRRLSPTLVWNYPTIEALAERLGHGR
ncbi:PfaD family protein [Tistlia consotensis]|uniref:PfaD family protein n=1 Tax=Tistlia consotensis USBA 355 TaxID=560819 RepID=A0A1Y6BCI3_9PROT|nr:PfaD family polyunsaturated fatty acid/polyketide biosynthesis protein [Tistlia consotensis]SMF04001.1 PfaD family protein [Tistlia consotensis USBA 355]SNR54186.1 PfaD family protein [Tistlia consotensis]